MAASQCFSAGDGPTRAEKSAALAALGIFAGATAGIGVFIAAGRSSSADASFIRVDASFIRVIFSSSVALASTSSSLGRACLFMPCTRKLIASSKLPLCSSRAARLSQYAACVALGSVLRTAAGPSSPSRWRGSPGVLGPR